MRDKEVLDAIKATADRVMPVGGMIILYGSRARGDWRPDSDWDVLILLDKPRLDGSDYDDVAYPLRSLGWDYDAVINPVLYTKNDWEANRFTPFYKNVTSDGIRL